MTRSRLRWTLLAVSLAVAPFAAFPQSRDLSQRPDQTQPLVDQSAPTAAELSAKETVASAFLRSLDDEEYELRSVAEQIKHVACANFAFSAELDGKTPPPDCDKGGPSPAKTRDELVSYLRDSFKALRKSLSAVTQKNMFDPIEGPYAGPNTRLGIANVAIWHGADHYGQLVLYMRLNGIVPPASRPNPPELKD